MNIEKTERGYRIHHAAGGFTELWRNHSGIELAACAAIDDLLDRAAEVWAEACEQGERTSRSIDQLKEALQDRSQRFTASYSEVMQLIRFYEAALKRRDIPNPGLSELP